MEPLPRVSPLGMARILSGGGTWIAEIGRHFVVIDGLDDKNNVIVRDPWAMVDPRFSQEHGSRYRVSWRTFLKSWGGVIIWRIARRE